MTELKGKDSIMKMLLSSPNHGVRESLKSENLKSCTAKDDEQFNPKLSNKLQQLFGQGDGTLSTVDLDHNYSRPWNWRPENSYTKPVKTLFVQRSSNAVNSRLEIDGEDGCPAPVYDGAKARQLMEESEKHIDLIRSYKGDPDWEDTIDKSEWSPSQSRLFERVVRLLNVDRLARLASVSSWNEPVLRRISINKTASRFRATLASVSWDPKLIQWLHNLLMDNLDTTTLIAYVDVLQTLKSKVPTLVDRMMANPSGGKTNTETLNLLLQRPWDPVAFGMSCYNPKKLPGNPVLLMVPSGPNPTLPNSRTAKWHTYLSQLGTVMSVSTPTASGKVTLMSSLEQMMAATRAKISEIKSDYMGKNIILVGLNTGAALACQVALMEHVTAVVCLGFPLSTAEDKRGQPDDNILNLSVPVLFVIGQHAATASVDDMEDLRERLHVETSLVVVGAADDQLRINKSKQALEGITQSMVDRCVVDEIGDFVGTILSNPYGSSGRGESRSRYRVVERKRRQPSSLAPSLDEQPTKRQILPANSGGSPHRAPYVRRRGLGSRGGRSRWTAQVHRTSADPDSPYKQEGVASITRAPGSAEKTTSVRPLIDNISVVNSIPSEGEPNSTVDTSSVKILPQIKVLSSEDCRSITGVDSSSLVDELTPDSLLEMPVIIAQEEPQETSIPVKFVMSRKGRGGIRYLQKSGVKGEGLTKIFLKKKEATMVVSGGEGNREAGSATSTAVFLAKEDPRSGNNKPRIRHFPATKRSDNDTL